jgi:peptidoglycan/LPS O-acetylase OafA/YrhL
MIKYRKELDGLRCLAVMAVIVYHSGINLFGFKLFKGGFFGVDVFFVLSGYLITDIVISKLDGNKFSFIDFFWRRAKRIFPALIVMLAATSVAAYVILLPNDLVSFSHSLKSAVYFGSNYHFLGEDSYVSDASIFKPLLHTWSLSVEWQFYLIYPFVLFFINKFFERYRASILLSLTIISLIYANHIVVNYPDLAFYTLPPRAWELMLGGLMCFIRVRDKNDLSLDTPGLVACKMLPTVGMFMIIYSMIFIDSHIPHPSFITLFPVVGACLVIAFANDDDIITAVLSLSPVVFVGTISYSMYLWHQPIFVFFRYLEHEYITPLNLITLTAVTFVVSCLSYKFIESPFRGKKIGKQSGIFVSLLSISVIAFSFISIKNEGFPNRLQGKIKDAYEMYKTPEFRKLFDSHHPGKNLRTDVVVDNCGFRSLETPCRYGNEAWVTIGDSYAGQYDYELLKELSSHDDGMVSLAYEQCPFVNNIWFGNVPECLVVNEQRWKYLNELKNKKNIVVATNYNFFWQGKQPISNPIEMGKKDFSGGVGIDEDRVWKSYAENIKELVNRGHQVYVIYPVPAPMEDVQKLVFARLRNVLYKFNTQYTSDKNAYHKAMEESLKLDSYLPDMPGLHKIRPIDTLCEGDNCKIIDKNGGLYHGQGHLSQSGVKEVLSLIDKK